MSYDGRPVAACLAEGPGRNYRRQLRRVSTHAYVMLPTPTRHPGVLTQPAGGPMGTGWHTREARSRTASSRRRSSATSSRSGARGREPGPLAPRSAREPHGAAEPDREPPPQIAGPDHGDDRIAAGSGVLGTEHDRLAVARYLDRTDDHRARDL